MTGLCENVASLASLLLIACSASGSVGQELGQELGAQTGGSSGASGSSGQDGSASGGSPPIGPEAGCGYALIPTVREPGSILLVVDRSASMDNNPDGDEPDPGEDTKWDLAQSAVGDVLNELPDDIRVGLLLYPKSGAGCEVDTEPQVDIAPLGQNRAVIKTAMGGLPWGDTPTEKALWNAYAHLASIPGQANRGIVLLTDGAWNCGSQNTAVYSAVEYAYVNDGILTFAIGIPGAAVGALSHLVSLGGGSRFDGCNGKEPDYWHPLQSEDCGATLDNHDCCHYPVDSATYVADLTAALSEVASKFLTSCVFAVPKSGPGPFDPDLVNVYVDGTLIPQNSFDGWTYVGGGTDSLEIHGPTCDLLLTGQAAKVEIQLGCVTYVK